MARHQLQLCLPISLTVSACSCGGSRIAKFSQLICNKFAGLTCSPSWVHLFRECQIDHMINTISALSPSENIGALTMPRDQVSEWSRGRQTTSELHPKSVLRVNSESVHTCIRCLSIAKQSLHWHLSWICHLCNEHWFGRIPLVTLH